jgi:hypothetical protein
MTVPSNEVELDGKVTMPDSKKIIIVDHMQRNLLTIAKEKK